MLEGDKKANRKYFLLPVGTQLHPKLQVREDEDGHGSYELRSDSASLEELEKFYRDAFQDLVPINYATLWPLHRAERRRYVSEEIFEKEEADEKERRKKK